MIKTRSSLSPAFVLVITNPKSRAQLLSWFLFSLLSKSIKEDVWGDDSLTLLSS